MIISMSQKIVKHTWNASFLETLKNITSLTSAGAFYNIIIIHNTFVKAGEGIMIQRFF